MIINKKDEIEVLKEIQKNAGKAMQSIDTISQKVYDDGLALQLSRQALKYSDIHNRVVDKIIESHALPVPSNQVENFLIRGDIHMNTLLNTSTSHIAEVMIQETNKGLTNMWKTLNHHGELAGQSMEMAKEFMDFEIKNIDILKKYL